MIHERSGQVSLTEGRRAEIIASIREQDLSEEMEAVLQKYETGPGDRNSFLWKWAQTIFPHIQFSSVDTQSEVVIDTKTIVTILVSLYDDLLEKHGDHATFEQAFPIPFYDGLGSSGDAPDVNREYLRSIEEVWAVIDDRVRRTPRHDEFRQYFEFDLRQILDAIEYTALVNDDPEMANMKESRMHESHNMSMFVYADIDLMCSPGFDRRELGAVREAVWHGQQMARIGNWLSTWERELGEGDYSSAVVVRALEEEAIDPATLQSIGNDPDDSLSDVKDRIRNTDSEQYLLELWEDQRTQLLDLAADIDSVDIEQYAAGLETLLEFHLASRGLK